MDEESALMASLALDTAAQLNAVDSAMVEKGANQRALQIDPRTFIKNAQASSARPPSPDYQPIHQSPPSPVQPIVGLVMPQEFSQKLDNIDKKLDYYISLIEKIEKNLGKMLLQNTNTVKITLTKHEDSHSEQRGVSHQFSESSEQNK